MKIRHDMHDAIVFVAIPDNGEAERFCSRVHLIACFEHHIRSREDVRAIGIMRTQCEWNKEPRNLVTAIRFVRRRNGALHDIDHVAIANGACHLNGIVAMGQSDKRQDDTRHLNVALTCSDFKGCVPTATQTMEAKRALHQRGVVGVGDVLEEIVRMDSAGVSATVVQEARHDAP